MIDMTRTGKDSETAKVKAHVKAQEASKLHLFSSNITVSNQ